MQRGEQKQHLPGRDLAELPQLPLDSPARALQRLPLRVPPLEQALALLRVQAQAQALAQALVVAAHDGDLYSGMHKYAPFDVVVRGDAGAEETETERATVSAVIAYWDTSDWTCPASYYGDGVCHCGCGTFRPLPVFIWPLVVPVALIAP